MEAQGHFLAWKKCVDRVQGNTVGRRIQKLIMRDFRFFRSPKSVGKKRHTHESQEDIAGQ